MHAMLSRATLALLLCLLVAGAAAADPFQKRKATLPEGAEPPREPKVVWPEIVEAWQAFAAIERSVKASDLDVATMERMDAELARLADRVLELNLGLLHSDVTRSWVPRTRLSLELGVKFIWADLAPLRGMIYRQVPGAVPPRVKPVEISLWSMQGRFPDGYLEEPLLRRPSDLPYDPDRRKKMGESG